MTPRRPQRGDPDSSLRLFLIADVRGYTSFTQAHGDAAAARLAMTFAEVAREAVAARGGRVVELRGDEALAVFASASQAVRAGIELQAACLEEMHAQLELPLRVGVGIDAGEAVPVEGGYRGAAINMAARLCSQAAAGEVLVTRTVAELAGDEGGDFSFVDRGKSSFKGIERPVDVLEAVAAPVELVVLEPAGLVEGGLELSIPLVGRMDELHWLRGTWRIAHRGRGRVLFLSGDEGIGKTRLAEELAVGAQIGGEVLFAAGGGAAGANAAAAVKAAAA
ncbi:MAG: hypothetical protein QOK35_3504, partial [Pseudonocardiales bacterium]|nr:hypothetical protein [Pseudonocardiales bacterium]